jgi:hypothetical protein
MRERNIGWRLDYIMASESLAATASHCSVYREVGTSDHAPVIATFELKAADRPLSDKSSPVNENTGHQSSETPQPLSSPVAGQAEAGSKPK